MITTGHKQKVCIIIYTHERMGRFMLQKMGINKVIIHIEFTHF